MENIPDQEEVKYSIKEDLWNTESNIVRNTVKNNLHKNGWMMTERRGRHGIWMLTMK